MPEFIVIQNRDARIGDTWFQSGVFGLDIGSTLNMPGPCPICGAAGSTCIGESNAGNTATQHSADEVQEHPTAA